MAAWTMRMVETRRFSPAFIAVLSASLRAVRIVILVRFGPHHRTGGGDVNGAVVPPVMAGDGAAVGAEEMSLSRGLTGRPRAVNDNYKLIIVLKTRETSISR
jgi:hypothetical protein